MTLHPYQWRHFPTNSLHSPTNSPYSQRTNPSNPRGSSSDNAFGVCCSAHSHNLNRTYINPMDSKPRNSLSTQTAFPSGSNKCLRLPVESNVTSTITCLKSPSLARTLMRTAALVLCLTTLLLLSATATCTTTNDSSHHHHVHEFTILTTNDLHSHFEGNGPLWNKKTRGHFARVAYLVRHIQSLQPNNTITLDAGDFFCGTLLSMLSISYLFPQLLPELQFLKYIQVDATTIGNHEAIHHSAEFGMLMRKYWESLKEPYFYGVPHSAWTDLGRDLQRDDYDPNIAPQSSIDVTIHKEENKTSSTAQSKSHTQIDSIQATTLLERDKSTSAHPFHADFLHHTDAHYPQTAAPQPSQSATTQTFSIQTIFPPPYDDSRGVYLRGAVPILRSNVEFIEKCNHLNSYHNGTPPSMEQPAGYSHSAPTHGDNNKNLFPWFVLRNVESAPHPITGAQPEPLRVGIFSSYGVDAADISQPTRGGCMRVVGFNDSIKKKEWNKYVSHIYKQAKMLRNTHGAQFVILVAHEGEPYNTRLVRSLEKLAQKEDTNQTSTLPLIDVIVSSHTHKIYSKNVDGVHIIQSGANGENLGVLRVAFNSLTRETKILNPPFQHTPLFAPLHQIPLREFPQITPIDSSIPLDRNVLHMIEHYKRIIDRYYLPETGFQYSDFLGLLDTAQWQRKSDLMRYIANCVHEQADQLLHEQGESPLDVYFLGASLVRASPEDPVFHGNLTFSDVQRILGYGSMTAALNSNTLHSAFGDAITHFYLTVDDFKRVEQARMLAGWYKPKYFFQTSSIKLETVTRKFGIPFVNRIKDVKVEGESVRRGKLIHVAISHTALHFFQRFKEYSLGIVDPILRDKYGRPSTEQLIYQQEYMLLAQCIRRGL